MREETYLPRRQYKYSELLHVSEDVKARRDLIVEHHQQTLIFVCPCGKRLTWSRVMGSSRAHGQQRNFQPIDNREDVEKRITRAMCECGIVHWKRYNRSHSAEWFEKEKAKNAQGEDLLLDQQREGN